MSTIKLTQEELDRKAHVARLAVFNITTKSARAFAKLDPADRESWRNVVIAVLESDGDKVEIVQPEPEIPDDVLQAVATQYKSELAGILGYSDAGARRVAERLLEAARRAGWGGWLPGREPK